MGKLAKMPSMGKLAKMPYFYRAVEMKQPHARACRELDIIY